MIVVVRAQRSSVDLAVVLVVYKAVFLLQRFSGDLVAGAVASAGLVVALVDLEIAVRLIGLFVVHHVPVVVQ